MLSILSPHLSVMSGHRVSNFAAKIMSKSVRGDQAA